MPDWDARRFDPEALYVEDVGERPAALVRCARLGIPAGRDEHLQYRYVDPAYAAFCTRNPLRRARSRVATMSGWMGGAGAAAAGPGLAVAAGAAPGVGV